MVLRPSSNLGGPMAESRSIRAHTWKIQSPWWTINGKSDLIETEDGPSGKGGTQVPPTSVFSSIAGHHPNGRVTSSGPPHLKS
ncbi:hypothetical protein KIN20_032684 [Parelaphostrongylus tenuis]|uniref:Uncharacterized protein n=1 Tax=Parelaphostrongylus tenuis TaxID=148309 RepID=A0AAD5WHN8_PARTN|nr:hypothetical protein KIN20_032684 [Parelaphostrongylus tenuis]